jgi:uncharacterized protein (TIGR03435 family)
MMAGPGRINFRGVTMTDFIRMGVSPRVGRMVLDRTGLEGSYDLEVEFSPEAQAMSAGDSPAGPDRPAADRPSIYTALQEQLGLKLESRRGPVDVLIVDRAELPTAN